MKKGFDVRDYSRRMDVARKKVIANWEVSLYNRSKILEFLDCLETQEISLPRRIGYLQNISKLAAIRSNPTFTHASQSECEQS